ncbi:hypothetical protein RQP46_001830 [Phenoliferia psychrophenolica]
MAIGALYVNLGYTYIETSRDIQRMLSSSKSPIFSALAENVAGITTIRAFSSEQHFQSRFFGKVDAYRKLDWYYWMCNRWCNLCFDLLGGVAVFFTIILALVSGVGPGFAALAIVSAQSFFFSMYWFVRWATQLEIELNAVERVNELLDIDQEPPGIIETRRPPAVWPSGTGGLDIEDLVLRYAPDLPAVIKGLSVSFQPREKIGIVGRTGSGKTTLAMSLLRFVDPSRGRIILDGVDITEIGLTDLRSRIAVIPQVRHPA